MRARCAVRASGPQAAYVARHQPLECFPPSLGSWAEARRSSARGGISGMTQFLVLNQSRVCNFHVRDASSPAGALETSKQRAIVPDSRSLQQRSWAPRTCPFCPREYEEYSKLIAEILYNAKSTLNSAPALFLLETSTAWSHGGCFVGLSLSCHGCLAVLKPCRTRGVHLRFSDSHIKTCREEQQEQRARKLGGSSTGSSQCALAVPAAHW